MKKVAIMGAALAAALPAALEPRRGIMAVRADAGSDAETRRLLSTLEQTFAAFRQENDARLEGLEKGRADVVTNEKVDRINATIDDLKKAIDEQAKATARLQLGGAGGETEVEAARQFFARVKGRTPRLADQVDVAAYRSYRDAFAALARAGGNPDALPMDVRAAASIGSDRDGGYLVPTEMSTELERRIFDTSPMRQVARVITIGTSAWSAPYKASKGVSGGWVGERQARTTTGTGTMGMQRIEVHEQYAYPEATQDLLDDASVDVEAMLVQDTEDEMSRQENSAFVTGDGVMKPKGFLAYKATAVTTGDATRDWGKLQYIVTGAAGGIPEVSGLPGASDPDAFIDTVAALHPNYRANARWAMSRTTEAEIRKMKDADGRYLIGMGSVEGGLAFNLFGFPIVNLEDMEAIAANSFSVAFGDWRRGYFIIDRVGFRMLRDPYTNKPYVGFYITKRVGGDVRNFDAIKLMKFGTS